MNETLKQSADLFVENKNIVDSGFTWENPNIKLIAALEYTLKGLKVNVDLVKEAEAIIKKKVRAISEFKGHIKLALAVQMAQSDSMEDYFDHVQAVYKMFITDMKLTDTADYYIIASMIIVQHLQGDTSKDAVYVSKARSIYARMKENHPRLTHSEDISFATLLAVSSLEEDAVVDEMETCFNYLKEQNKFSGDGLQSLTHVLSLEVGNSKEKCDKVVEIYDALHDLKKKFGTIYELSTLGGLAYNDVDSKTLANDISEVDDYLKTIKGFGNFTLGAKERLMYAAILVMQYYSPNVVNIDSAALTGTVSLIIAEQTALIITMMACSTMMMVSSH